ncbi:unnamed protein product [Withania somnifera]
MRTYVAECSKEQEEGEDIFWSRYPPVHVPDNVTLTDFVLHNVELYADRLAFVNATTGKGYTYGEVARDIRRKSLVLPNIPEYVIVALGIMAAGGVFSGPAAHSSEIMKQVESADGKLIVSDLPTYHEVKDCGLPVIILGEERVEGTIHWDELHEAADRNSTTGLSKGVMLTHRNLVANLCSTLQCFIPFFHIYAITGICCATIRNKGKVVVMRRYELRAFLNALITHEVTFAPVVPPIILALVKNPTVDEFDIEKPKLRSIMTAAAPLVPEILNEFKKNFPDVQVQEAYGMTERGCIILSHSAQHIAKRNSVGFILPNLEVKFVDPDTGRSLPKNTPGKICVKSQRVMKVAPAQLEGILVTHPSVEDAALVGLPDEEAGEIPAAWVVLNTKAKESHEDIINYIASTVAQYKRVTTKLMKRTLRQNG